MDTTERISLTSFQVVHFHTLFLTTLATKILSNFTRNFSIPVFSLVFVMKKIKTKFSRVLNNGAKHRVVKAIWILSTFLFLYQVIPRILWKTPPTFMGLEDPDFHNWPDNKEIVILHWTAIFKERSKTSLLDGQTCEALSRRYFSPTLKGSNLSQMYCRVTFDRRYLPRSNVLLFHSFDLMYEDLPMETQRRQDQLWVWLQLESPIYTRANLQMFPNVFNWTMTYR